MSVRGSLQTMPVGDLLEWLNRRRATGSLTLARGPVVRRFLVEAGTITQASTSEPVGLLGKLLVERGLLRPAELERALRTGRETGTRLGRVLTLLGLVAESELGALLAERARTMLSESLSWTDGRFVFEDRAAAPPRYPMVRISVRLRDALNGVVAIPGESTLNATP
jgi:hypothetical protein